MTKDLGTPALIQALKELSPIHFIGVGGSGMRPLAELASKLLSSQGAVSGSDVEAFKELSSVEFGLEGSPAAERLLDGAKSVVYSSAITKTHLALTTARAKNLNLLHRSELLALFTRHFKTIAVAGTHGKSTTSALITHALREVGLDPSWIIGAPFADGVPSYGLGKSSLLVIEADESDGTFLRYAPTVAVLNNIEADHMDFYQSLGRLEQAFETYVRSVPDQGGVCFWQDSPAVQRAVASFSGRRCSFGLDTAAQLRLVSQTPAGLSTMVHMTFEGRLFTLNLPLPGQHNVLNALAAISALQLVGVGIEGASKALSSFSGVKRRLQRHPGPEGVLVFDDYAHNPGKIRGCLAGLTAAFPGRHLIAVFQPHRFSRLSSLYNEFVTAFLGFSVTVVVVPVYASGEAFQEGFDPKKMAVDIETLSHVKTFSAANLKDASKLVKSIMNNADDLVVTLGAGDVWRVAEDLARPM